MEPQFPVLCSSKPLKAGLEKFQRIPITREVFKLGSGQQNTVVMPLKCLSKDHCIFKKEEDSWILENCSYSSIKINGNKLRQGQKWKLCDQDVIKLESSNEFVYTFTANVKKSTLRKKRKADVDNLQKDSSNKKKLVSRSHSKNADKTDVKSTENEKLKEQVMLDKDKKEKQIYDDYAVQIEKLKGSKTTVKRRKALLKMRRDIQLKEIRAKIEDKISSLTAKHNDKKPPEEKTKEDELTSDSEVPDGARARNAREKDNKRQKERKELRKLRRETRQLKLDKEMKLKEMENQKLHREKALKEELNKVNKKLAKEIKMHEKEKRRVEQLLSQKKVSPSASTSKLDMESELMCSICSELFVHATTLGCSHSYCRYCIRKWTANRNECPICRATIKSQCSSIVLDSLIDKMAESEDGKKKRQQLVTARDELEAKEAVAAVNNRQDDDDFYNPYWATSLVWRYFLPNSDIAPLLEPSFHAQLEMIEMESSASSVIDGFDDSIYDNFRISNSASEYEGENSMEDNDGEDDENDYEVESDEDENEGENENNYEGEHDEEAENDHDGEHDDEAENDYEGEHDDEVNNDHDGERDDEADSDYEGEHDDEAENDHDGEHDDEAENDYEGEHDDEADNDYEAEHDDEADNDHEGEHDDEAENDYEGEHEDEADNDYEGEHDDEAENDYEGEHDDEADNDYEGEHDDEAENDCEGENEEGSDHDEEEHYDEGEVSASAPENDDYDEGDNSYPDDSDDDC